MPKRSRLRKRPLAKYQVTYLERVYGAKSPMVALKREYAPTLKEAKEWAKVIVKDKTAKDITVFRLPKKEWF